MAEEKKAERERKEFFEGARGGSQRGSGRNWLPPAEPFQENRQLSSSRGSGTLIDGASPGHGPPPSAPRPPREGSPACRLHARCAQARHAARVHPPFPARAPRSPCRPYMARELPGVVNGNPKREVIPACATSGNPRSVAAPTTSLGRSRVRGARRLRAVALHGEPRRSPQKDRRWCSPAPRRSGTAGGGPAPRRPRAERQRARPEVDLTTRPRATRRKASLKPRRSVDTTYRTQVQTHSALETHGAGRRLSREMLTVYASTQGTATVRDELAEVFKLAKARSASSPSSSAAASARSSAPATTASSPTQLSKKAGAPVRLVLDRREEQASSAGNRPERAAPAQARRRKDGTLTAVDLESLRHRPASRTGTGTGGSRRSRPYPLPERARRGVRRLHAPRARRRVARARAPAGLLRARAGARRAREPARHRPARAPPRRITSTTSVGSSGKSARRSRLVALGAEPSRKRTHAAAAAGSPLKPRHRLRAVALVPLRATRVELRVRIHRDGTVERRCRRSGHRRRAPGPRSRWSSPKSWACPSPKSRCASATPRYPSVPHRAVPSRRPAPSFPPFAQRGRPRRARSSSGRPRRFVAARRSRKLQARSARRPLGAGPDGEVRRSQFAPPGEPLVATGDRAKDYEGADTAARRRPVRRGRRRRRDRRRRA